MVVAIFFYISVKFQVRQFYFKQTYQEKLISKIDEMLTYMG